jgi:hypothetical protein
MSITEKDAQEQERRQRAEKRRTRGFNDSYVVGRVCSASDCTTVLSKYNEGPNCWKHSDPTPSR